MNTNPIFPDDPRLTAYALDEMAAAERVEFEKLLGADPVARQAVAEIRAAGSLLSSALENEPVLPRPAVDRPVPAATPATKARPAGRVLRFPQIYYMVSGLAAACFAVFFVIWQQGQPGPGAARQYIEVGLGEATAGGADTDAVAVALPVAEEVPAITMGRELPPVAEPGLAGLPSFKDENGTVGVTEDLSLRAKSSAPAGAGSSFQAAAGNETRGRNQSPVPMEFAGTGPRAGEGQVVTLSPFAVGTEADGYVAATTIAGNRMKTELRDEGNAVSVDADRFIGAVRSSGQIVATAERERQAMHELSARKMSLAAPGMERGFNTEAYGLRKDNDYRRVADHPLSTFSVDVDTASYANVRRFLVGGQRPPADAVRIEELVNYFPYDYAPPAGAAPFAASLEVAAAPWAPAHRLVRIGLKGREVSDATRPAANLVFLLDVSGSMRHANKLPLVKQSLRLLVNRLRDDDRVAIAVYAGSSGLALPSTPASRKAEILEAIERLEAGGSTNGGMGIHLAYDIAKANHIAGGVNRVILATDGDFNVGTTGEGDLVRLVEEKAKGGVFLSVLGFGMGNLKDGMLEQIADRGNGNYAYIDLLTEAKKALVEQAGGTLVTIAKDVKIQVEFNPAQVAAYRLIGHENRLLAKEDFNNDAVDAGEIGAGHTVTALYEIVPAGAEMPMETPAVDELKYQRTEQGAGSRGQGAGSQELLTVKIRYKEPAGEVSSRLEFVLRDSGARFEDASQDFKFAAAVAAFGMALRDSPHKGSLTLAEVAAWGRAGTGSDAGGYRGEFLSLVEKARAVVR